MVQFGAGVTAIGHHLLLEDVDRRFTGAYTCTAANTEGRQVSNILILEVKSKIYKNHFICVLTNECIFRPATLCCQQEYL